MAPKKGGQSRKNARGGASRKGVNLLGPAGTLSVPRGPSSAALPVAMRTQLRYFAVGTLSAGAANVYGEYMFRSNSLYDPDYSGPGVQPAGFAALATLYSKYRVLGATVTLTVVNDSGGSTTVVMSQKTSFSSYTSVVAACTQGFAKRAILSDQSGGRNQVTFRTKVKPWNVLGVSKERYMVDDQFAAAVGTNPALVAYMGIGIHALTVSASVQWQMDIIFDAVLFDRLMLV